MDNLIIIHCKRNIPNTGNNFSSKKNLSHREKGAALVVSLILLLIMTIIGVTSLRTTTLEEKMAGNMRDKSLAFQAAEAALRDAEIVLSPDNLIERPFSGVPFKCSSSSCVIAEKNSLSNVDDWWNDAKLYIQYARLDKDGVNDLSELKDQNLPQYAIEELEFVPDELGVGHGVVPGRHYYRIISRGVGGSGLAQSMLETTYTRRF